MNLIQFVIEICLFILLCVAVKELMGGLIHAEKAILHKTKKKLNKWANDV